MPPEIWTALAVWFGFNALFVAWRWYVTRNRQP